MILMSEDFWLFVDGHSYTHIHTHTHTPSHSPLTAEVLMIKMNLPRLYPASPRLLSNLKLLTSSRNFRGDNNLAALCCSLDNKDEYFPDENCFPIKAEARAHRFFRVRLRKPMLVPTAVSFSVELGSSGTGHDGGAFKNAASSSPLWSRHYSRGGIMYGLAVGTELVKSLGLDGGIIGSSECCSKGNSAQLRGRTKPLVQRVELQLQLEMQFAPPPNPPPQRNYSLSLPLLSLHNSTHRL